MSENNNLTEEQKKALIEFKRRISGIELKNSEDSEIIKWLKARSFDVTKTESMLRESVLYKQKMDINSWITSYTPPEKPSTSIQPTLYQFSTTSPDVKSTPAAEIKVIKKYYAGGLCGFDKEGSPIAVELFGKLDLKGLMMSARRSDFEKLKLFQCEGIDSLFNEQTKKLGHRVDGITVIFDMEDVGTRHLWQPGLQLYLHMVKILEDNYPEMMKRMFVVNAPSIFPVLYKICRPLVSEDMRKKIFVLGSNEKNVLLKYISEDQLPAFLGGTQTDPDGNPRCATKLCQGGEVPRQYYLKEDSLYSDDMQTTVVPSRDNFKLCFDVTDIGSVIRWEFRTENYDISFGVKFYSADGDVVDLVPNKRVTSHVILEDGSVVCDNIGTYTVVFDNTSSWTRNKKLWYRVEHHSTDDLTNQEVALLADISETSRL